MPFPRLRVIPALQGLRRHVARLRGTGRRTETGLNDCRRHFLCGWKSSIVLRKIVNVSELRADCRRIVRNDRVQSLVKRLALPLSLSDRLEEREIVFCGEGDV